MSGLSGKQIVGRLWLILLVAAIVIGLDQWTKALVRQHIPKFDYIVPIPAFDHYVLFEHVDNYGAAFGILQGGGSFFIAIAAVVVVVILVYAVRSLPPDQRFVRLLLGLQMGGAIGIVIDRIHQGYVTDFIKVGVPNVYYWPNFNIADSAIVGGVIGLAVLLLWQDFHQPKQEEEKPLIANSASSSNVPEA